LVYWHDKKFTREKMERRMAEMAAIHETQAKGYEAERTAVLVVDPYNDFLSEGGKLWPKVAEVANAVGLHGNLRAITVAARKVGIPIFIVPHHRAEPDFAGSIHPTPYQLGGAQIQAFAKGGWGGE
jgi:nicotinamidase-related amidase